MISITSKLDRIYIWHVRVQAFKMPRTYLSKCMKFSITVLYYLYIFKNKIYFYSDLTLPRYSVRKISYLNNNYSFYAGMLTVCQICSENFLIL